MQDRRANRKQIIDRKGHEGSRRKAAILIYDRLKDERKGEGMNLEILQSSERAEEKTQEDVRSAPDPSASPEVGSLQPGSEAVTGKWIWNPDGFAREQLRGLVQRIFFSHATARMRQIVISAVDQFAPQP